MRKERLNHFKGVLEKLAADLQASLESGRDLTAVVPLDDPIGRLSRTDALQSQEMSLGLKANIRQRLEMVRRALDAVANGSYGTCVGCKRPISELRLEALPETPLCVECAT
ncbi:MAG: TraR/DksA C4-type zinc finger protein [Elusimicrobia bacterium]|nr:TraR/DksA C4-type zinc finger protein [Elusimicrobiota bacterium]